VREMSARANIWNQLKLTEERLREALFAAQMGTWEWDLETGVLEWSYETEQLFGRQFSTARLGYQDFLDTVHPDDRERIDRSVRTTIERGGIFREQYRIVRPAGDTAWILGVGRLQRDAGGRPIRFSGVASDLSEQKRVEDALRAGEARFRGAFDHSADGMALIGADGCYLQVNASLCLILGYSQLELVGRRFLDFTHPGDVARDTAIMQSSLNSNLNAVHVEKRYVHKNGDIVWCEVSITPVHDAEGAPTYFVSHVTDVTERKRTNAAHHSAYTELDRVISSVPDCLYSAELSLQGSLQYLYLSPVVRNVLGVDAWWLKQDPSRLAELVHPDDRQFVARSTHERGIGVDSTGAAEFRVNWPDGTLHWVRDQVTITRQTPTLIRLDGVLTDITERKALEQELAYRALHDSLTGLANRLFISHRLERALTRRINDGRVALLFLDVDNFKVVNDSLGHDAGDGLLVQIAARLMNQVGQNQTIARFGGDEFVVLIDDVRSVENAIALAERLMATTFAPFAVAGRPIFTSISAGIAITDDISITGSELLGNADAALYRAKSAGPGQYVLFDPRMRLDALAKTQMEEALRHAIRTGSELFLHYQPVIDLKSGQMIGVEALVRWLKPDGVLLTPDSFIPLAEETGLISKLDDHVLIKACHQLRQWDNSFPEAPPLRLNVNFSPLRCREPGVVARVSSIILAAGIACERLTLEITERVLVDRDAHQTLAELRAHGLELAIDDFGTGFSSLGYLGRIGVDQLKIDRQFISGPMGDEQQTAIARAILAMGHSLGLKVTAEGIETIAQLDHMTALGCDYGQGNLVGLPSPPEDIHAKLALMGSATPGSTISSTAHV
jgi:diguanylate cyclase (GGDEF)-like protein/PAS domain S-box-containing protein